MQSIRGGLIKVGLGVAVVAFITAIAKGAVSIVKREIKRVGERAAIKKARGWAKTCFTCKECYTEVG